RAAAQGGETATGQSGDPSRAKQPAGRGVDSRDPCPARAAVRGAARGRARAASRRNGAACRNRGLRRRAGHGGRAANRTCRAGERAYCLRQRQGRSHARRHAVHQAVRQVGAEGWQRRDQRRDQRRRLRRRQSRRCLYRTAAVPVPRPRRARRPDPGRHPLRPHLCPRPRLPGGQRTGRPRRYQHGGRQPPAGGRTMTRPGTYLIRMALFLIAVGVAVSLLSTVLLEAFYNNPMLNSFILLVLALGIAWNLRQVLRLSPEVTWLEHYQTGQGRQTATPAPKLLAPMASMLAGREEHRRDGMSRFTLSATAMRSLLDGIASRLDESRELSRYMTGLLIFLGLLGTFWGLLKTVHSVSEVIGGMTAGSGDLNMMFEQLKSGLTKPLAGMGTAFSASMFGLAGALVLGFLDLTAGQAQNRFFNELEE